MTTKNVIGIAALIIAVVFATQMTQQVRVEAQQTTSRTQSGQAVEYAVLEVQDENNVTFRLGDVNPANVRTESVANTYRRLGGRNRGTFPDLLNQIGSLRWNLIEKDGNNYIFSRPAT